MDKKINKYTDLPTTKTDYYLIGGGIMSGTLGVILKLIYPNKSVIISERLGRLGAESSDGYNNAGTGHAGYCELNYTTLNPDGSIDITKAVKVNNAFKKSLEFWSYLIETNLIKDNFKHVVPHYSFVTGEENVKFLSKRHMTMMKDNHFRGMKFEFVMGEIHKMLPLLIEGRKITERVAVTKFADGLDVDFGSLTIQLFNALRKLKAKINVYTEIVDLYKVGDKWCVIEKNRLNNQLSKVETDFVFIGAGGAAITLLEKSGIPEAKNYAGFPISGQWLICRNKEIVDKHHGKVYGKAGVNAPPMSVPHLDTRILDGEKVLFFGPYAGITTKFLNFGSSFDLFKSLRWGNIKTYLSALVNNMSLNRYLINEVFKSKKKKLKVLKEYYPNANEKDWELFEAGKRVQIIKNVEGKGVIEFGTEIVSSEDGSLACLLGASPGASTSVKIMVDVLNQCFTLDNEAKNKIAEMIPSYNKF
jgi:malate dehydrogenase (quinone)